MQFNCVKRNPRTGKIVQKWPGRIQSCKSLGNECYELYIVSLSTIFLALVNTSRGWVVAAPDWRAGCYLSQDLCDVFYNTERLAESMKNKVDAITVAYALAVFGKSLYLRGDSIGS